MSEAEKVHEFVKELNALLAKYNYRLQHYEALEISSLDPEQNWWVDAYEANGVILAGAISGRV